ncbi:cytochrome P450 [Thozetella sp. PMI_491]|nr:cytochrome P450 [Thozetella sp. PMI_491]
MDFNLLLDSPWAMAIASGLLLGVVSHHAIRPYEIDNQAIRLVQMTLAALAGLAATFVLTGTPVHTAILRTLVLGWSFVFGMFGSVAVYRAFFHRLRSFPGPFFAKLSKFYLVRLVARSHHRMHLENEKLHAQYGDFVRVGPREVSINRPSAIAAIYGPTKSLNKGRWYANNNEDSNFVHLLNTRDMDMHKRRKRAWERGLGFRALATYEPRVRSKVDLLISRLGTGKPIDVSEYALYFGFDVMGEVGFSKDFNMLEKCESHPAITQLHALMDFLGLLGHVPWLMALARQIRGEKSGPIRFIEWCNHEIRRKQREHEDEKASSESAHQPHDVATWLIKAKEEEDRSAPPTQKALEEDSRLLIIAGSDTTSIVLGNALYYFTKYPGAYRQLQQALDTQFPGGEEEWSPDRLKIPYLDWVIYETLRLKPPVPGGVQRVTPPEGLQIDEVFIPGDVTVYVPTYAVQRDERFWKDGAEFVPERWDDLSTEKAPFIAFTRGDFSCPGRNLAMMELRMVISRIAMRYNIAFAPGEDGVKFDEEIKDTFTFTMLPLHLVFTPRNA